MTISSYATLKTAVATRLARSNMTSLIADFIAIAHDKMMIGDEVDQVPPLRIYQMLVAADLTPSGGEATLPSDYLEMKRIYSNNSSTLPLTFRPPEDWYGNSLQGESGTPAFFTVEGLTLKIAPQDTTVLKSLYYGRVDQLSADADTNAIISRAAHAYLYGALAEAYDHIRQHDRSERYARRFGSAVRALNDSSDNGQMSGGPLIMMPSAVA